MSTPIRRSPVEKLLRIQLDNSDSVCYAGDILRGKVILQLKHPLTVGIVQLFIRGKGVASWKEHKGSKIVRYSQEKNYLQEVIPLWNREIRQERAENMLPPGLHHFPFEIRMPSTLPSSYEGKYGFIQYHCKARISKPFKLDQEASQPFTVIGLTDLNSDSQLSAAVEKEAATSCHNDKELVKCRIRLPKTGYVCGEVLAIQATIRNHSSEPIGPVRAALVQRVQFTGRNKTATQISTKERFLTIEEAVKRQPIDPNCVQLWANEGVRIPPTPPSTSDPTALISISYYLEFVVGVNKTRLTQPIVVGSIPFRSNWRQSVLATAPCTPDTWDFLRLMPPPSYEECVQRRSEIQNSELSPESPMDLPSDHILYTPLYACYANLSTAQNS